MKVGDLVWHVDDIKDDMSTPGIVTRILDDPFGFDEAVVMFIDREFEETHPQYELRPNLHFDDDENIMGNPDA